MRTLIIATLTSALLTLLPLTAAAESFTEAELLEAVRTHAPSRYEKLMALKDTDPDAYEAAMERVSEKLLERRLESAAYSERVTALKARFEALAAEYTDARPRRQEEIRAELESLAAELLEIQLEAKRLRLEAIQAKVDRMEEQLSRKEAHRDEIIRRYVEEALEGGTGEE
jgi:CII-binding regulator of phage lambda lysogenization HflD